jgi:hypothetical protein
MLLQSETSLTIEIIYGLGFDIGKNNIGLNLDKP